MVLGLIPIVSENIGIMDVIKHGENGFVYNSEKPEEFREILNEIFLRKYDLNIISKNAKKIRYQLSWQNIADEYHSVYKKLL